jgi:hypothetical protein
VTRSCPTGHDRTREQDPRSYERFAQAQAEARRALSERDVGASFGAFTSDTLIADLASSAAVTRPAIRASAPTMGTVAAGLPPTSSAWPHSGPPIVAGTNGSSSPRPRTRQAVSTAAFASSQTPENAQAYRKPSR